MEGECVPQPVTCNDNNKCTIDSCYPETGECIFESKTCPDTGDNCNPQECDLSDGECKVLNPVVCDDQQPCTLDSCIAETGECSFESKECDQISPCAPASCNVVTGQCQEIPVNCDDQNACTQDFCTVVDTMDNDPTTGQVARCDHTPITCDDSNPCTVDSCDIQLGCQHVEADPSVICDDNDQCTVDTCSREQGCQHEPLAYTGPQMNCQTPYCDPTVGWLAVPVQCLPKDQCYCDEDKGGCVCPSNFIQDEKNNVGIGAGAVTFFVIAGFAAVVFVGVSGKKSYDYWTQVHSNKAPQITNNPFYQGKEMFSDNPLFDPEQDMSTVPDKD